MVDEPDSNTEDSLNCACFRRKKRNSAIERRKRPPNSPPTIPPIRVRRLRDFDCEAPSDSGVSSWLTTVDVPELPGFVTLYVMR